MRERKGRGDSDQEVLRGSQQTSQNVAGEDGVQGCPEGEAAFPPMMFWPAAAVAHGPGSGIDWRPAYRPRAGLFGAAPGWDAHKESPWEVGEWGSPLSPCPFPLKVMPVPICAPETPWVHPGY